MEHHNRTITIGDIEEDLDDRELLLDEMKRGRTQVEVIFFDNCPDLVRFYNPADPSLGEAPRELPAVILLNGFPRYYNLRDEVACLLDDAGINQIAFVVTVCGLLEVEYIRSLNLPIQDILVKPIRAEDLEAYLVGR